MTFILPILFFYCAHLQLDLFLKVIPQLITPHNASSLLLLLTLLLLFFLIPVVPLLIIHIIFIYLISLFLDRKLIFWILYIDNHFLPRCLVKSFSVILLYILSWSHRWFNFVLWPSNILFGFNFFLIQLHYFLDCSLILLR